MAPVLSELPRSLFSRATPTSNAGSDGTSLGAIYVLGIVLAVAVFAGLLLWLGWRKWQQRKAEAAPHMRERVSSWASSAPEKGGFSVLSRPTPPPIAVPRPLSTASIVVPSSPSKDAFGLESPVAAYLPPLRRPPPLNIPNFSGRPVSSASATPSRGSRLRYSVLPENKSNRATMTENEILDYHLQQGNTPIAFAPIAIGAAADGHRPVSSIHGSVTADILGSIDAEAKHDSSSTTSSLPWPKLRTGPKAISPTTMTSGHASHGRWSSFSASIRFPGGSPPASPSPSSPARSFFTFGRSHQRQISQLPAPTADNQRTVKIAAFSPLLPDELVIRADEVLTIVQSYDDNWCIVARMHLGMLEVGAVPDYVFGLKEGEHEAFGTMRPMRSTSLGVTVDLRVIEAAGAEKSAPAPGRHWAESAYRDSVISWSNFQ